MLLKQFLIHPMILLLISIFSRLRYIFPNGSLDQMLQVQLNCVLLDEIINFLDKESCYVSLTHLGTPWSSGGGKFLAL